MDIRNVLIRIARRLVCGGPSDDLRPWFEEYMADVRAGLRKSPPRGIIYACSCCGYPTQTGIGRIHICPLCSWNDLGRWEDDDDEDNGWVRKYTLEEARRNFSKHLTSYSPDDDRFMDSDPELEAKRTIIAAFNLMPVSNDGQIRSLWRAIDHQMSILHTELVRKAPGVMKRNWDQMREKYTFGPGLPDTRPRKYKGPPEGYEEPKIHIAAAAGDLESIRQILDGNPDKVELRNYYGQSPLYVAVDKYQVEAVRLLLERGADPDGKNKKGWTPLLWCAAKSTDEEKSGAIAELLIAAGADINDSDNDLQWPPMYMAVREGNCAVQIVLRKHGVVWG